MNLQQLNRSGQSLWVFIVTGVIALLVTGVSWLCVEVITSYKGLPKKGRTDDSRRNNSFTFRVALFVWLVKNGHTAWMWHSGAWLCILSNSRLGRFHARAMCGLNGEFISPSDQKLENACDYVYRSIQSERFRLNFDLSTVWRAKLRLRDPL